MNKLNNIKIFAKKHIWEIILICLFTLTCYLFPYTHDDWAWGTEIGIERLTSLFANYNGRWARNIFVIVLTRNRIFRALCESISLVLIIYLINKLSNSDNKNLVKFISIILLLLIPVNVFAQAIAWTSGYANYVVPVLIVILYIYLNKNIFNENKVEIKNRWAFFLLLLGFAGTLFVEHLTIYILLLAIFFNIILLFKDKKVVLSNIAFLVGSICGTILMFSNGAYSNIFNSNDSYRTISLTGKFTELLKTYCTTIKDYLIDNNIFLNIILILFMIVLLALFVSKNRTQKNKGKQNLKIILANCNLIFLVSYLTYIIFVNLFDRGNIFLNENLQIIIESVLTFMYAISVIITAIITVPNREKVKRIIFEVISIVIIAAPLLVVTPIGPRCFFATYVFFVLLTCEFASVAFVNLKNTVVLRILKIMTLLILMCYIAIFSYIFLVDNQRIDYIEENKDISNTLVLPKLPFTNYMQGANPASSTFIYRFKLFYGIDEDVELKFIDYDEWKENYK